jgi:hypothetical protein
MNKHLKMEYNSEREPLTISEYGRSVQDLVNYAKGIEKVEEKQAYFDEIIELILRMKVNGKKSSEYKEKVWRHIFKIANFELDGIVMPNGEIPKPKKDNFKPPRVDYPTSEKKFRHYGHNIQSLIKEAIAMEEGPKKEEIIRVIASFMKLAYKTWNPEHYMNESMIRLDLETLSDGKLSISSEIDLDSIGGIQLKKKKKSYITQTNQKPKKKRKRK